MVVCQQQFFVMNVFKMIATVFVAEQNVKSVYMTALQDIQIAISVYKEIVIIQLL